MLLLQSTVPKIYFTCPVFSSISCFDFSRMVLNVPIENPEQFRDHHSKNGQIKRNQIKANLSYLIMMYIHPFLLGGQKPNSIASAHPYSCKTEGSHGCYGMQCKVTARQNNYTPCM